MFPDNTALAMAGACVITVIGAVIVVLVLWAMTRGE